jgi:hypothetical protein
MTIPRPTPERGLNPYFIHPDDSTGWPSGPHCRYPRTEVECIHCVVPDGHKHTTTQLWRFDRKTGVIHTQRITCASKKWEKDGFARHDWLWNGGPAGSNANMVYEALQRGWTTDKSVALTQQRMWLLLQVMRSEREVRAANGRLAAARLALKAVWL